MAKGKHSGRLEDNHERDGKPARQRKDYTVHVLEKDGSRVTFECGSSLTGANQVRKAVERYGGPKVVKMAVVASEKKESIGGTTITSQDEVDSW